MDSTRPHPPALPPSDAPPDEAAGAPPAGALATSKAVARLARAVPVLRAAERTARRVAVVSAASAVVLALVVLVPPVRASDVSVPLAVLLGALLLAPAGLTWLGVSTLRELLTLPGRLHAGAVETAGRARAVAAEVVPGGSRVGGVIGALWAARALAGDARQGALRVGAVARLLRLTRLPLLLLMVAGFAFNFAVIAAAFVALVVLAF